MAKICMRYQTAKTEVHRNMLSFLRTTGVALLIRRQVRRIHQVPFHDDLTPVDEDLFNLEDFQHYRTPENQIKKKTEEKHESKHQSAFESYCSLREPVVFVSKLSNPYLNLALEDYIYGQMPIPEDQNCNRLMFYVNSPCVVIGKNQNPWQEVNLPVLNSLKLPLVRRRSGGGTVVHDSGNVNYSFMTTKGNFDRFTFANLVKGAVNKIASPEKQITVNERGDIITEKGGLKVSGSAYKLSKGKSYHHGTMLLNSRLDVLRELLHRDEAHVGTVIAAMAIPSVKSLVTNVEILNDDFIASVSEEFQQTYGIVQQPEAQEEEFDQTDLFGLSGLVQAYSDRKCKTFVVDDSTDLPREVLDTKRELQAWDWAFGSTSRFTHTFEKENTKVTFTVMKGFVESFVVEGDKSAFEFLEVILDRGDAVKYTGSDVAGFVTDDALSEWIGESIDGTS